MKGELLLKALEIIEDFSYTTADLIDVFLSSSKTNYLAMRNFRPRYRKTYAEIIREKLKEKAQDKKTVENLLFRLQRDGLIVKSETGGKPVWEITKKGAEKKEKLAEKFANCLPFKSYKIEKSKNLMIISFDIPEKARIKRDWLRNVLVNSGFKMLQKSVWLGRVKFPEEFINDLKEYELLDYVEIFSVNKFGTIKSVI